MRFTQAYAAAPICSASRAALQAGKTTARLQFEFVTKNKAGRQQVSGNTLLRAPPFTLNLRLKEVTIGEHLGKLGYHTGFFGKWHLNAHYQGYLGWSPTHGPPNQGYDAAEEDFGSHPYSWKRSPLDPIDARGVFPKDSMIDRAAAFLRRPHDQPFFLMVSQFYVHTPVKTRCQWLLDKYQSRVPARSPNRDKRVAYAAFVEELDHRVGRLTTSLEKSGCAEDTLVIFTSDNGGHPEFTANGPLRGSKWNLYEGGIRAPLIAQWPRRIAAGSVSKTPVIGYDLLPTLVDAAEADVAGVDGHSFLPTLLKDGGSKTSDRTLLWHFPYYHPERGYAAAKDGIGINDFAISKTEPQSAIRKGSYKLIYFYESKRCELYDLGSDPSEQHDLADQRRELADSLTSLLMKRLRSVNARLPTPK